jgi:glutaminase
VDRETAPVRAGSGYREKRIGGGIVRVSPDRSGLGTFAPLLDEAGNSVRARLAARFLSRQLGLDLCGSEPRP